MHAGPCLPACGPECLFGIRGWRRDRDGEEGVLSYRDGPWRLRDTSDFSVAVISWEDLLASLGTICSDPFADDLAQFQAIYRVLIGDDIEPFTSKAELRAWREREGVLVTLVERVTRILAQHGQKMLPMGCEGARPNDYHRRYVCPPLGTEEPCFSVGVRQPFDGHITPIWLRFNHSTPMFSVIQERLLESSLSRQLVPSDGHIWIPLDVPLNAGAHRLKSSLVAQAEEVIQVAYQPLP